MGLRPKGPSQGWRWLGILGAGGLGSNIIWGSMTNAGDTMSQ